MNKTYYALLEVPSSASMEEIKKAYRKKAKEYHPDMNEAKIQDNPRLKNYYNETMAKINEAHEVLSDLDKRREYDRTLREQIQREQPQKATVQREQAAPPAQQTEDERHAESEKEPRSRRI